MNYKKKLLFKKILRKINKNLQIRIKVKIITKKETYINKTSKIK